MQSLNIRDGEEDHAMDKVGSGGIQKIAVFVYGMYGCMYVLYELSVLYTLDGIWMLIVCMYDRMHEQSRMLVRYLWYTPELQVPP